MRKKLLLLLALFTISMVNAQTRVLYYTDYVIGTDQMAAALVNAGCAVTTATSDADFQTQIATPANFDMAVYFVQNYGPVAGTANALANFVNLGKKGMYCDWSMDATTGALFGVGFTGNTNQTSVFVSDPSLASGLTTNPFTISNTGWGVFSVGLVPLTGSTVSATFVGNGEPAIVRSMSGNMYVFGYLGDAPSDPNLYVSAITELSTTITTSAISATTFCAGETLNVPFTIGGTFNVGNVFTAELSDAVGSFAGPVSIGTLTGTIAGTISATIPAGAVSGTGYRVRVVGSSPSVIGSNNGTDITINSLPVASATSSPILCNGGSTIVTISATGGTGSYVGTGAFSQIAGTAVYTVSASGCSDTVSVSLVDPAAITASQTLSVCSGGSVTVGSTVHNSTGTYTDVIPAFNGCDSTVTTSLTVQAAIDVTTSVSGTTISANAAGLSYQWVDCNSAYAAVAGQTSQSYASAPDGSYAVIITNGSCVDTSSCVAISTTGIQSNLTQSLAVYPNPVKDQLVLEGVASNSTLVVYNGLGQEVMNLKLDAEKTQHISMSQLQNGIYIIKINNDQGIVVKRITKQ